MEGATLSRDDFHFVATPTFTMVEEDWLIIDLKSEEEHRSENERCGEADERSDKEDDDDAISVNTDAAVAGDEMVPEAREKYEKWL